MSIPYQWPDDPEADRQWQREQMALRALEVGDLLAEVDELILAEVAPEKHPLFSLAANALDRRVMPGTPEALMARYRRLIDHAVERLIERKLANPDAWEVD